MLRRKSSKVLNVNKPFKPPRVAGAAVRPPTPERVALTGEILSVHTDEAAKQDPQTGRDKVQVNPQPSLGAKRPAQRTLSTANVYKRPRASVTPQPCDELSSSGSSEPKPQYDAEYSTRYFMILYRKKTMKKNKTWDGDGVMVLNNNHLSLKKENDGKLFLDLISGIKKNVNIEEVISIGQYEVEVDYEVTLPLELEKLKQRLGKSSLLSGSVASNSVIMDGEPGPIPVTIKSTPFKPTLVSQPFKPMLYKDEGKNQAIQKAESKYFVSNRQHKRTAAFTIQPDSLVMDKVPGGADEIVDVVVDPILSRQLRPHQREGVKFLYNSVMGINSKSLKGALLADQMGLGKTLMTITLIWTLLRQSPYINQSSVAKKVLVIAPVTLIGNWKKEFKKWLNLNRIGILTVGSKQNSQNDVMNIKMFGQTRVHQVLLLGYEKLVTLRELLNKCRIKFDLLVCDEGHRLKSGSSKALQVLNSLNIERKVLLSGTPIQNDLEEFYTLINFINPGILGSYADFQKDYMKPILRSRETNCYNKEILKIGNEKSEKLIQVTKSFILRRTNEILNKFLPPRTDLLIFVRPTRVQVKLFQEIITSKQFINFEDSMVYSTQRKNVQVESLAMINLFKKICNSPSLVQNDNMFNKLLLAKLDLGINDKKTDLKWWDVAKRSSVNTSSKLRFLMRLLNDIKRNTDEKVVVISNYTKTLDLIEGFIKVNNMTMCRLDGSIASNKRDAIINGFNDSSQDANFIFLLSSKSGGVGLNLIGASRLVLFDNDWNPSVDLQAMARIHRDGQKRPTFIYRLMTTGCIDEKILQRQLMKINLSNKFLDDQVNSKDDIFDYDDLRELFKLELDTKCHTHDLVECDCDGTGLVELDDELSSNSDEENQEDSDAEGNGQMGWVSAKAVRSIQEESSSQGSKVKGKKIKGCLEGYSHMDPGSIVSGTLESCGDSMIDNILTDKLYDNKISYIFAKVSK